MIDDLITDVMRAEGWDKYTDHPADRGGPTKWGITLKSWGDYLGKPVTAFNVRGITEAEARRFYLDKYVREPGFASLPDPLLSLVVDSGVNHGPRAATKWVQRSVGAKADGFLGPITLQAILQADVRSVYLKVLAHRVRLYGYLVTRDPRLKEAIAAGFRLQAENSNGWNNRAAKWLDRLADFLTDG